MRMMREARACGALKHPNIVEVLDVDQTPEGDPYLVMQLLSGETLGELLQRQRRLESAQAARIVRPCLLFNCAAAASARGPTWTTEPPGPLICSPLAATGARGVYLNRAALRR